MISSVWSAHDQWSVITENLVQTLLLPALLHVFLHIIDHYANVFPPVKCFEEGISPATHESTPIDHPELPVSELLLSWSPSLHRLLTPGGCPPGLCIAPDGSLQVRPLSSLHINTRLLSAHRGLTWVHTPWPTGGRTVWSPGGRGSCHHHYSGAGTRPRRNTEDTKF